MPKERDPLEAYDERVLGSGAFVEQLRQKQELKEDLFSGMEIPELMGRIEKYYGITPGELGHRRRNRQVIEARDVFCYLAVRILSHSGTKAGQFLNIKRSAVSHAVGRGNAIIIDNPNLIEEIIRLPH